MGLDLWQHLLHERSWRDKTGAHPLAHICDGSVNGAVESAHAAEEVVVVLDGLEGVEAGAGTQLRELAGEVAELIERHQMRRELRALDRIGEVPLQDAMGEPAGVVERVRVD